MKYLIFFLLFMSGCSPLYVRHGIGIGDSLLLSQVVNKNGNGKRVSLIVESNSIGGQITSLSENFKLDSFIQQSNNKTIDSHDTMSFSIDIVPRLRYTRWETIQPYLGVYLGTTYFTKNIKEQETPWGFNLGTSIGIKKHIYEETWIYIQYDLYHESNGSSIFGSPKPNNGINSDIVIIGIEYKF